MRRDEPLLVRFFSEEREQIGEAAAALQITPTEFIRRAALVLADLTLDKDSKPSKELTRSVANVMTKTGALMLKRVKRG